MGLDGQSSHLRQGTPSMNIRVGILTISDRSFRNEREDLSGPAIARLIESLAWTVVAQTIIPDEIVYIQNQLTDWADSGQIDLILTTGGTGFSPRDITPEATLAVLQKTSPGIPEAMRMASLKLTPHAMLSRAAAGIRNRCLIINLPGSPKAAIENLQVVIDVLPHAIQIIQDSPSAEAGHIVQ